MAQMQNAQTVALQLEKVPDKLPLLYERDDILLTMIQQRGDVERVSSRNMRLPLQIRPGGKAGLANMDGMTCWNGRNCTDSLRRSPRADISRSDAPTRRSNWHTSAITASASIPWAVQLLRSEERRVG